MKRFSVRKSGKTSRRWVRTAVLCAAAVVIGAAGALLRPMHAQAAGVQDENYGADERVALHDHYYQVFNAGGLRWEEAKAYCESLGGHLVTITNQEEENLIEELLSIHGGINYWMGAEKVNGQMQWVTGETFEFTNWGPGQPDHAHETSLMMYTYNNPNTSGDDSYQWNDLEPGGMYGDEPWFGLDKFGFICEWEYNVSELTGLSVQTLPRKTVYHVQTDPKLDTKGLVLKATYSDGYVSYIRSGFQCAPTTFTKTGKQKVTATYNGKSTSFYVTVNKPLASVAFKSYPTQKTYKVGDSFQPAGMVLKATYTDGGTADVSSGFLCSPETFEAEGQQKVTVSYGGKELRMYVAVHPKDKTVTSVGIAKKPSKLNYHINETFQPADMVLKITYSDKSTQEVTSGYTYTPSGKLTAEGQQRIAVTYAGVSTGFNIAVHPVGKTVKAAAVKTLPARQTYKVGEKFDPAGLVLTVTYSDGTKAEKTTGYTYTPTGAFAAEGQQQVVITYAGKTASFYVGVNPKNKTVSSVGFRSYPTKKAYHIGEAFAPAGMVLKITYSDGTTAEKTAGYTVAPGGALTEEGQQRVTVTYANKTARFYVAVHPAGKTVKSVGIAKKPSKLNYHINENFQPNGLVLKVIYSDGTSAEQSSHYTYTPSGKLTSEGQQRVEITYAGKSVGFNIAVHPVGKTVKSIAVKTLPTKRAYQKGETFNPAGLVLSVTYSDGTTAQKSAGFTYTPTGKMNTVGQQAVVITFAGKNTTFNVTVK